jgi:hypothetical protein
VILQTSPGYPYAMGRRGERAEAPIFVVGAVRSGTTLMRLVLDSHENIAIAPETGFMRVVQANKFVPFWMWGAEWYTRLGLEEDELDRELAAFYGGFFRGYAEAQGKPRWGEKTPYHTWHLEKMARLWPQAVFVATVRHPGGNVGSLVSKWHLPLSRAIARWKSMNRQLVAQSEPLGERLLICRYEDLVLDTEQTLRELLNKLGEPWSPSVLQHEAVHRARGTARVVEGRTRSRDAIDRSRVTAWAEHLRGDDLKTLERETGAMARFFGYSFDDITLLEPLVGGRPVVTGTELAERRAQFPEVRELHSAPVVPAKERPLDPDDVRVEERERTGRTRRRRARKRSAPTAAAPRNGARLLALMGRRLRRLAGRPA